MRRGKQRAAGLALLASSVACDRVRVREEEPEARELADARALQRLADWTSLPNIGEARRYEQQSSRDRGSATEPFLPVAREGNTDYNHFVCASRDARLGPLQLTPFRFDLAECPESYVRGAVLGRFEGSGALVRTWMTMGSLLFAAADEEVLRIYVDDDPVPLVETPLAAAMDGSAGEPFAPPFGAGSNLRLAWYHPVAFENKLIVALDGLGNGDLYYYQCDVAYEPSGSPERASEQGTPEQGTPEQSSAARELASEQLTRVDHPAGTPAGSLLAETLTLAAGAARDLHVSGPGTLQELEIRILDALYPALAEARVQVRWDGAAEPAIDVSLRDVFGAGERPPALSSLALTSELDGDRRVLVLKLPMPFASAADFRFENLAPDPLELELAARGDRAAPAAPFGHLYVHTREVRGPSEPASYVAASAEGRGRFVGACSHARGRPDSSAGFQADSLNLLEGDVRATSDGRLALDGTGSEDYADDVFYFADAPQATAFAQTWNVSQAEPLGTASYCRWHVLGTELDFLSQFELRVELGGFGNPNIVESHRTVSYFYLAPR